MKLSIRQQKYKKNLLLGMNHYNAAIAAGYSKNTAKSRTKDLDARIKIEDVLERQGLTDNVLVKRLLELLEASEFVFKKTADGQSEIVGNKELYTPCWAARGKGLELALKLKDLLKDKGEHPPSETKIIIMRDGDKTKAISRQIHLQSKEVPGDGFKLGHGEVNVRNTAGNDILRADTEQPGDSIQA